MNSSRAAGRSQAHGWAERSRRIRQRRSGRGCDRDECFAEPSTPSRPWFPKEPVEGADTVRLVAEHVVPTLTIDQTPARNRLEEWDIGGDRCRPDDSGGHQVPLGVGTDDVEFVGQLDPLPILQA